jgi:tRNA-specific 2-thiouridylase
MRVVVAMSGGVDSSVAAALLAEQGHEVVGLSMQLYDQHDGQPAFGTCCSIDDLHDARRVASALDIPHFIVNFERPFKEQVVANFVREYLSGRTPLPCAHCNSDLKFATLLDRARGLGAEGVATGHYARVERDADGRYVLRRGLDASKDQSYFLFALTQEQLCHALFPVGGWHKDEVREYARARKLPVADKADSQELCFVPDGDYARFIDEHADSSTKLTVALRLPPFDAAHGGPELVEGPKAENALGRRHLRVTSDGPIVDREGTVLGRHSGVHHFTVGQRKGLGLATGAPLYVLELRPTENTVVVGPREALEETTLTASLVNWIMGTPPSDALRVQAQIRYRHRPAAARVQALDAGRAEIEFDAPQTAITPGQAVVFYDSDRVVGGGWID